ncbi:MAG: polysaccharide deacetylase family protein [Oscillospiraceae bacterium]
MGLYDLARKVNAKRKAYLKMQAGKSLSPVRRIEKVCPPKNGRFVAMTFDDGPDALDVQGREQGLTQVLLDELKEYDAHVTFDVIGSTKDNYPDTKGEDGTFMWSGNAFDHYPEFGKDELAGAKNQPELIKKILGGGHEISNHGSTHRLFGKMRAVYGARKHFDTLGEVIADLQDLHTYMESSFGYTMKLGRPAHYIDNIPDGSNAYDAYRVMGYNYMAASFDGAGWQPLPTYEAEVSAMVEPLERALAADPEALNGRIIFQKDGCNMARRTPIADALPKQLEILKNFGYRVVSVSELLNMSPFEDMSPDAPEADSVRFLLGRGHTVGYKNNTFGGDKPITEDELYIMLARPETLRAPVHMTLSDMAAAAKAASRIRLNSASGNALLDAALSAGVSVDESLYKDKKLVRRSDAVLLIAELVRGSEK